MSSRRTLVLLAAVAVGAVAAFALFNYVRGVEDRANEGAERVQVFVVREAIAKGVPGSQAREEGLIAQDEIPREFLPETAIQSLEQIEGKVALNALAPNQPVVEGMFVDPAESQVGFAQRLDGDEVAITISVDDVRGVAGLLVPGDEVNILVTAGGGGGDTNGDGVPDGGGGVYSRPARFLFQAVRILAIGQSAAPEPGDDAEAADGPVGSGSITFSVPPEAAQQIASVEPGSIYLTLLGPDYSPVPLPPLDPSQPLPGESGQLTPYGPSGAEED